MPKPKSMSDEQIKNLVHELHEDEKSKEDNRNSNCSEDDVKEIVC